MKWNTRRSMSTVVVLTLAVSTATCTNPERSTIDRPDRGGADDDVPPSSTIAPSGTTPTPPGSISSPTDTPRLGILEGGEWELADPPASFDVAYIDSLVEASFEVSGVKALRSVVVVHDDRIVYERYHPEDDRNSIMASYSVAKSFASAVVGILIGDGRLDLDAPAPVPEWSDPSDPRHAITLENLLHMSSGMRWTEGFDPLEGGPDVIAILGAPDAAAFAASRSLEAPPASVFEYNSGTSAIIGRIIADEVGGAESVERFIRERLLEPIGIQSTVLQKDPTGRWIALMGADSTTRDFARFGLLYLHDGVWGGTRVLPENWVSYSSIPTITNDEYGAHWWIVDGELEARGLFGQHLRVSPSRDVVIAINRDAGTLATPAGAADLVEAILDQFDPIG